MNSLRYPIGTFQKPDIITHSQIGKWIDELAEFPSRLRNAVADLTDEQLDTPYREGGWTVRQVVHHVADSHMNAYIRIKLALTENNPEIRPYDEKGWANLPDSQKQAPAMSIELLEILHIRLVAIVRELTESQLNRSFWHPQNKTASTIVETLGMYAWHGHHHLAHIEKLKKKMKW